ncbi:MAG: hypothetical protein HC877_03715 [Thioploca sp.]|nr:hypothetical protein [Thioploca sp.]
MMAVFATRMLLPFDVLASQILWHRKCLASTSIALGLDHACAVVQEAVFCWGAASSGQLSDGIPYIHGRPIAVPGLTQIVALEVSSFQACALNLDGAVSCWGSRPNYTAGFSFDFLPHKLNPPGGSATTIRAAASGRLATAEEHTVLPFCAKTHTGWWCLRQTWSQGLRKESSPLDRWHAAPKQRSPDGQCGISGAGDLLCAGIPSRTGNRTVKTKLLKYSKLADDRGKSIAFVEATSLFGIRGKEYVCARMANRRVRCFDTTAPAVSAAIISPALEALNNIVQLAADGPGDEGIACALDTDGAVWCWGSNHFGQLGEVETRGPFTPVRIIGLPPSQRIGVGGRFVCALTNDSRVFCWGSNRFGAAPDGALGKRDKPAAVVW